MSAQAAQAMQAEPPTAVIQGEPEVPRLEIPRAGAAQPPALAVAAPGVDAFARTRRQGPAATYTVRKGDTLAEIAAKLGTDVEDIARANGLKRPYRLQPGQVLKNPKARGQSAASSRSPSARSSGIGDGGTYTVKSGDTLYSIAQRHGTTVEALRAANGLGRSATLIPGRKLKLPGTGGGEARAEAADEDTALADRMAEAAQRRGGPSGRQPVDAPDVGGGAGGPPGERVAAGRVISIDVPGKAYKVKKGDTLDRIAGRLDSDIAELARINKLKKPYRLQPGQTIRGPGTSAKAYVVARGDTLAEIAQRFSVTEAELRSANGLRRGAALGAGRRLRLPAGYRDRGPITVTPRIPQTPPSQPPVTRPPSSFDTPPPVGQRLPPPRSAPRPPEVALPDQPQPYRPVPGTTPGTTPFPRSGTVAGAPTASPPVSDAEISQMGRGLFVWPIQGQVISGFGGRGSGPRNDGLNIRGSSGDPVRAAAAGDVVYAGDQVPGFGNLVLVKHADGWVTAYGHLGRVDVRMQQKVTQGQTIGVVGQSGGVSEPQLHFEVRYAPTPQERARPVDPALVLPR
jgi:murein DD-endopeptidase MepM/ murein hydrolase activator NlpD